MRNRLLNGLLWIGAALGAASLIAAAAVAIFGFVPLIFTSGSMSPEVPAGSLGVARTIPAADLSVGDVVSVSRADSARVTHRIVEIAEADAEARELTLKGDANERPDKERYTVADADRLIFSVPYGGYVVSAMASPIAYFLGGVLVAGVAMWLIVGERGGRGPGVRRRSARTRPRRRRGASAVVSLVAASTAISLMAQPSLAAFNDLGGTVTTSGFVAARVDQPGSVTCTDGGTGLAQMTISTTVTDVRWNYVMRIYTAATGGTQVGSDYPMTTGSGGVGSTRSVTLNSVPGLLQLGTTYYARVYARHGTTWVSESFRSTPFSALKVLVLTVFDCGVAPIAPTIGFTKPTNGMTGETVGTNSFQDQVAAACEDGTYGTSYVAACGTISDDGSVTSVEYILQRTGGTLGVRCWNGSSLWVTNCSYRTAATNAAKTKWSVPRLTAITYPYISDGSFELKIRATDNGGNVSESSINFTVNYP